MNPLTNFGNLWFREPAPSQGYHTKVASLPLEIFLSCYLKLKCICNSLTSVFYCQEHGSKWKWKKDFQTYRGSDSCLLIINESGPMYALRNRKALVLWGGTGHSHTPEPQPVQAQTLFCFTRYGWGLWFSLLSLCSIPFMESFRRQFLWAEMEPEAAQCRSNRSHSHRNRIFLFQNKPVFSQTDEYGPGPIAVWNTSMNQGWDVIIKKNVMNRVTNPVLKL